MNNMSLVSERGERDAGLIGTSKHPPMDKVKCNMCAWGTRMNRVEAGKGFSSLLMNGLITKILDFILKPAGIHLRI